MLALETSPDERSSLDGAFRAFHTLKGGAGIVDFVAMSRAVHAAEEALSSVRQGNATISPAMIGDCLNVVDQVVQWLDEIEALADLPPSPDAAADAAVARFQRVTTTQPKAVPPIAAPLAEAKLGETARLILEEQLLLLADENSVGRVGRVAAAGRTASNAMRGSSLAVEAEEIERALDMFLTEGDVTALKRALETRTIAAPAQPTHAVRSEASARSFRVDPERVDALVALTGELIVAKNAIARLAATANESGNTLAPMLNESRLQLERLVGRLKDTALNLRVAPLRPVFERFQRVVRELAIETGKPTKLVIQGEDTEADKSIVDVLFEPLLHIVRNAVDHGVESAAARAAAGKPAIATLRLGARREGEHVVIEVDDDGGGVDIERVRGLAAQRGLIDAAALAEASDEEVLDLIFLPGFSTKQGVTDLSGRGVGMDAVRTVVERIGGRVTGMSERGRGTQFRLLLPFSLMVTKVITVEVAGQIFGLPLEVVIETLRVPRDSLRPIGSIEAFVWRNGAVPLVDLTNLLGKERQRTAGLFALAVVVSLAGQFSALEVDALGEEMDVILKPIDGLLSGTAGISGTAMLGGGEVLLVLDLPHLLA